MSSMTRLRSFQSHMESAGPAADAYLAAKGLLETRSECRDPSGSIRSVTIYRILHVFVQ